jgi:hypothetical protein
VRATGSTTPRHALGQRNIRQGWRQPRPPRQTDNQPTRCRFRRTRAVGLEERSQIVRAESSAGLPMKSDGSVDEDKIPASDKIGEIEKVAGRSQKTQTFDLTSGTYVAFCNLVDTMSSDTTMMGSDTTMMNGTSSPMGGMDSGTGHVHFAKGMHVTFTVR